MSGTSWFRAEDFEEAEFDPNAYISRHSGAVPLTVILQRLEQHFDKIRVDLIDVINADYPLFIGMAEKLAGVEGAAVQIQSPMLKLKEALAELQGRYLSELTSLKNCLHQQSQVHHTKTMLELVQDATAVMGKVEALTADLPAAVNPSSLDRATPLAAQIERIASEVSRLAFYMTKGSTVPVIQSLAPRVTAVTSRLSDAISGTLQSTLQVSSSEAETASSSCIHACSLVNRMELAHVAVQDVLVRPALDRAASAAAVDADAAAPSSPSHNTDSFALTLPTFLRHVQGELEPEVARIQGMVSQHPDLATTFDILGVCTLSQVHIAVKAHVPGAFSPADPDAFHRNYSAAMSFLSWLEERAATEGALQLLQQSTECKAFRKAWNLAVYFSLRFQEIAGAFDEQLHSAPIIAQSGSELTYQQSNALLHTLGRCRDPTVTFSAVFDRFLKLQMQSILRYGGWLREVHPGQASHVSASGSAVGGTPMSQWAEDASAQDLVTLLADTHSLAEKLNSGEITAIQAQLVSATSQAVLDRLKQGVLSAAAKMLEATTMVEEHIVKRMLATSASWKRRVLSIAATYRMTARPPPSKPSHYVASLLEGPVALRDSPCWGLLPDKVQQALLVKIVESIISVLQAAARELLDTMAKTQASLSKLGRVRNSPAAGQDGGLSDIEKTQEQLQLDIVEFGHNIESLLQHPATNLRAFEELLRVAKGFPQQGGGQISGTATPGPVLPGAPQKHVDSMVTGSTVQAVNV